MSNFDDTTPRAAVAAFLERWCADAAAGALLSRDAYLRLFPGFEFAVSIEFDALNAVPEPGSGPEVESVSRPGSDGGAPLRIGRFVVQRVLGRGGQGVVYLARDERLHRSVALKVLRGRQFASPEARARFLREMELTARLDAPGICTVYDAGDADGDLWIALKYIEGETIADRLRRAAPIAGSTAELALMFGRVARTLHVAHEAGVVHRDIKPANLMIDVDGLPVVLDFGLAQAENVEGGDLTRSGDRCGTPAYMAPEQIRPDLAPVGPRTDVFALGATLFEVLARRRAFEGATRDEVLSAVLSATPADLTRLPYACDVGLARVVAAAMRKDPSERYPTAASMADDLDRCADGRRPRGTGRRRWSGIFRRVGRGRAAAAAAAVVFVAASFGPWFRRVGRPAAALTLARLHADATTLVAQADAFGAPEPAALGPQGAYATWLDEAGATIAAGRRAVAAAMHLWSEPGAKGEPAAFADEQSAGIARVLAERLARAGSPAADAVLAAAERIVPRASVRARLDSPASSAMPAAVREAATAALALDIRLDELGVRIAVIHRAVRAAEEERHAAAGRDDALWRNVFAALAADPRFAALPHLRVPGLVPLGVDPASGLPEFAVMSSGEMPERDPSGRLSLTLRSSAVLTLVPGGEVLLGADSRAATSARYDPAAREEETPPVTVSLRPYLIGKHEVSSAVWARVLSGTPSTYYEGWTTCGRTTTMLHPVETVSWREAAECCRRIGLRLPTEAEWESAARAGISGRWAFGDRRTDAVGRANFADGSQRAMGPGVDWRRDDEFDDGFCRHAPIGSTAPNRFGLCDVVGNVAEWCADPAAFGLADSALAGPTGFREQGHPEKRVLRGGGWRTTLDGCRLTARRIAHVDHRDDDAGFRFARSWPQ